MNPEMEDHFNEIRLYAHMLNWEPDWAIVQRVYGNNPDTYSILTPFAYTYLEELIRERTSEYGRVALDNDGNPITKRKVGLRLIKLAKQENAENTEFLAALESVEKYFVTSQPQDSGDNRNSVLHGFMHPRYWTKESFEGLIEDIARLSRHAKF